MTIINLTPHAINVEANGVKKTYPASETPARVSFKSLVVGKVDGFLLSKTEYGEVTGLPEQEANTYYIVSMLVKAAAPNRNDLICPDSGRAYRDSDGNIVSVPGFII